MAMAVRCSLTPAARKCRSALEARVHIAKQELKTRPAATTNTYLPLQETILVGVEPASITFRKED